MQPIGWRSDRGRPVVGHLGRRQRTHGRGLEGAVQPGATRPALLGPLLTAAWNLLPVPAALALGRRFQPASPSLVPVFTASGILSLAFRTFGAVTRITPALEGHVPGALRRLVARYRRRPADVALGLFTIVLGAFAGLDAVLCVLEPLPFALFVLAAPKLPLAAGWSLFVGVVLYRGTVLAGAAGRNPALQPTANPPTASE